MGVIADLQMALPPIEIQEKIAAFLDYKIQQIDQLIAKKKALIEKLEEKRIAVITQAVTKGLDKNVKLKPSGVDWLGDVPEHWTIQRFKFCVNLQNIKLEAKETDLDYIGMENIESFTAKKIYDEENPTESEGVGNYFKINDVLFGKLRPYLAKALLCKEEGICSTELLVLEPEKLLPDYLVNVVLSDWFIKVVNSSTYGAKMPRASWDFIGELRCPFPDLDEQQDIISFINNNNQKTEKMLNACKDAITKLEEYRSATITSAVTGKIDVRGIDVPQDV